MGRPQGRGTGWGVDVIRPLHTLEWLDAQTDNSWGDGPHEPPTAITVGWVLEWPRKEDLHPYYRIAGSYVEDEPGGVTIIPADMVIRSTWIADIWIPTRG